MEKYYLMPVDGRKSFYNKAIVEVDENGNKTLISYTTKVIRKKSDGTLEKLWNGYSLTTMRHITAFCGIGKKDWDKMEVEQ